jgi:RNA:NAD 2'-phosphotransferase (TPT1/KptA family)
MNLPRFRGTKFGDIEHVVKENDKQRFSLLERKSTDGKSTWWIRANQGHSLEVCNL